MTLTLKEELEGGGYGDAYQVTIDLTQALMNVSCGLFTALKIKMQEAIGTQP